MFVFSLGLMEDNATGSAQCILAPYYFNRFGMNANVNCKDISSSDHLLAYQASVRSGVLRVALFADTEGSGESRVVVTGKCVTIMNSILEDN